MNFLDSVTSLQTPDPVGKAASFNATFQKMHV